MCTNRKAIAQSRTTERTSHHTFGTHGYPLGRRSTLRFWCCAEKERVIHPGRRPMSRRDGERSKRSDRHEGARRQRRRCRRRMSPLAESAVGTANTAVMVSLVRLGVIDRTGPLPHFVELSSAWSLGNNRNLSVFVSFRYSAQLRPMIWPVCHHP
jgi:hypothetical protein